MTPHDHDSTDISEAELDALLAKTHENLLEHAQRHVDLGAGLLAFMADDIVTTVSQPEPTSFPTDRSRDLIVLELRRLAHRTSVHLPNGISELRDALIHADLSRPNTKYLAFLLTLTHSVITVRDIAFALDRALAQDRALVHARARALAGALDIANDLDLHLSFDMVGDSARARARTNALARVRALEGALDQSLGRDRTPARAREFAGALAAEIAGALVGALAHPEDLVQEFSLDPDLDLSQALDLARVLDHGGDLALVLDIAHVIVHLVAEALSSVPINLSGADLSHLQGINLEVLVGAIWSRATTWSSDIREVVKKNSKQIANGLFRVRGGTERDPRDYALI